MVMETSFLQENPMLGVYQSVLTITKRRHNLSLTEHLTKKMTLDQKFVNKRLVSLMNINAKIQSKLL